KFTDPAPMFRSITVKLFAHSATPPIMPEPSPPMVGFAPVPNAPIWKLLSVLRSDTDGKVSPRRRSICLPVRGVGRDPCWSAPAGHPAKLLLLETQTVAVPE